MKILNTWESSKGDLKFFDVKEPVFALGEYQIFKQTNKCYLHTFKNIAINQLCVPNKEHIKYLINNTRPLNNTKCTSKTFIYDRAIETMIKGLKLIQL